MPSTGSLSGCSRGFLHLASTRESTQRTDSIQNFSEIFAGQNPKFVIRSMVMSPEMMQALLPVEEAFALHRGYAGLAFFMYEAFRAMPR